MDFCRVARGKNGFDEFLEAGTIYQTSRHGQSDGIQAFEIKVEVEQMKTTASSKSLFKGVQLVVLMSQFKKLKSTCHRYRCLIGRITLW